MKSINLLVLVEASVVECPRTGPVEDVSGFGEAHVRCWRWNWILGVLESSYLEFLGFWRVVIWSSWGFVRGDFRMGVN